MCGDVYVNCWTVVIILLCICISRPHVIHIKYTQYKKIYLGVGNRKTFRHGKSTTA